MKPGLLYPEHFPGGQERADLAYARGEHRGERPTPPEHPREDAFDLPPPETNPEANSDAPAIYRYTPRGALPPTQWRQVKTDGDATDLTSEKTLDITLRDVPEAILGPLCAYLAENGLTLELSVSTKSMT